MKKFIVFMTLALSVFSYKAANAILVEATFDWGYNGVLSTTGNFTANDLDNDGLLEFGEFSLFDNGNGLGDIVGTLLSDTGDIIISTNTWVDNGSAWLNDGPAANNDAYFSWSNTDWACTTFTVGGGSGCDVLFTSFVVDGVEQIGVPEPSVLALMSIGLIGLIGLARRKA